jgi:CRP-like cAMP-binding protein
MPDTSDPPFLLLRKQVEGMVKLSDEDWALLVPHLRLKTIAKNNVFISEGRKANELGLVLDGSFRQYYTKGGEEKTTYFFFEPHFIGSYISCITGKPSMVTIEALSNARYISFSYTALLDVFEKSMAWQKFGRLIAEYLCVGLEERMVSLLLQSPEERYIDLLNSHKTKITERIPQHYIANYLGITPVSMSRIRRRIQKKK